MANPRKVSTLLTSAYLFTVILAAQALDMQAGLHVMVTNDDGYTSPGLDAIVQMLRKNPIVSNITVIAPAENMTGRGNSTTDNLEDLDVVQVRTLSGYRALAVSGYPSDTVAWAVEIAGIEPDLVLSGVNLGLNIGNASCISGTVGAARTAALMGIPAVALSQQRNPNDKTAPMNFDTTARMAETTVKLIYDYIQSASKNNSVSWTVPEVVSINVPYVCTVDECDVLSIRNDLQKTDTDSVLSTRKLHPEGITSDIIAVEAGYIAVTDIEADMSDFKCPSFVKVGLD